MHTIIKNINNIYRNLSLVLLVSIMALTACSSDAGTSPPASPSFTATVLPRNETILRDTTDFKPDYYRANYAVFSIRSMVAGEYRIGAKKASETAPTAPQLIAATAAITRTLGDTDINIYLPYHIEGTFFNTGTTRDGTSALATALAPNTEYTVYITPADGNGAVEAVLSITTDNAYTGGNTALYGLPSSGARTYTARVEDPFLLTIRQHTDDGFAIHENGTLLTTCTTNTCFPAFPIPTLLIVPDSHVFITQNTFNTLTGTDETDVTIKQLRIYIDEADHDKSNIIIANFTIQATP